MGKRTTVLLSLDGIGITDSDHENAVKAADMHTLDMLMRNYPCVRILSAGMAAGLPPGQTGNALSGYSNIGAGRIVYQNLTRINKEIATGSFFRNPVLLDTVEHCRRNDSALHIIGIVSDGGVHSHQDHLYAVLKMARENGLNKVYIHCITDGRDTGARSGLSFIESLQTHIREIGVGEIATMSGRYYMLDRDNNYERIKLAYLAMTQGEGNKSANAVEAIQTAYSEGIDDEFIKPTVIVNGGVPVGTVNDEDAVIFLNLRSDREREIVRAFCEDEFRMFKREQRKDIRFVCFTDPDPMIENKFTVFTEQPIHNTLGEYLSSRNLSQLRISESETASYVTVFFDCGIAETYEGTDRLIAKSVKNRDSFSVDPSMKAANISSKLSQIIDSGRYDFVLCSIPNADIIGHGADTEATKKACMAVDNALLEIYEAVMRNDGLLFVCSTHGKAEQLMNEDNEEPLTGHTSNPVPFIMVNFRDDCTLRETGCLGDIAPTILEAMGLPVPREMTGKSLIVRKI